MPDSIAGVATTDTRQVLRQAMHYSIACATTTLLSCPPISSTTYSIACTATTNTHEHEDAAVLYSITYAATTRMIDLCHGRVPYSIPGVVTTFRQRWPRAEETDSIASIGYSNHPF